MKTFKAYLYTIVILSVAIMQVNTQLAHAIQHVTDIHVLVSLLVMVIQRVHVTQHVMDIQDVQLVT